MTLGLWILSLIAVGAIGYCLGTWDSRWHQIKNIRMNIQRDLQMSGKAVSSQYVDHSSQFQVHDGQPPTDSCKLKTIESLATDHESRAAAKAALLRDLVNWQPCAPNNEYDYQRASEALRPLIKRTTDLLGPQILQNLSYHPNDARNELIAMLEAANV